MIAVDAHAETPAVDVTVAQATEHVASITREAAANFYYGIALLPASKRRAMCAVYAFARRIDDIGDGELPRERKLALLERERARLAELSLRGGDPTLVALADAHRRFGLPLSSLGDLIDGVRMDVLGNSYGSFDELLLYCRRVAGSIGRLSLAIFGARDLDAAWSLADDLGVALQLTNILRDVREDAQRGRVYLPAEDLRRYGLEQANDAQTLLRIADAGRAAPPEALAGYDGGDIGQMYAMMRFQALRAQRWYARGMQLLPLLDRRSAACVGAMSGIYRRLLRRIEDRPDLALGQRLSLPVHWKAYVALGSLLAPRRVGDDADLP